MRSKVHPKYKTKYRVGNWSAYEQALVQRGDVTRNVAPSSSVRNRPAVPRRRRDAHHHPLVGVRTEDGVRSWRTSPATAWEHPLVEWARTATSYCSLVLDCDSRESQELACAVEAGYGDLPRLGGSDEGLLTWARTLNSEFAVPLPESEVRGIWRSVCRYRARWRVQGGISKAGSGNRPHGGGRAGLSVGARLAWRPVWCVGLARSPSGNRGPTWASVERRGIGVSVGRKMGAKV